MIQVISVLCFLVLAPFIGGFLDGCERKISARMQGRIGPPVLQPFYDVIKLFNKQTIIVNKGQTFLMVTYMMIQIFVGVLFFAGSDILMCFFLLSTGATFLIFVGSVTHSPLSTLGTNRELLQMMTYEPAVLLACLGFYLAPPNHTFNVSELIHTPRSLILYLPGFFVAFVFILTIKMRKSPFDLSTSHHAHQEVVKGITTELGSKNLAIYQITEWYEKVFLLAVVGLFIINENPVSILVAVLVALAVWFLEILIDNTNARVKWDVLLKTTWAVTILAGGVNMLILMLIY